MRDGFGIMRQAEVSVVTQYHERPLIAYRLFVGERFAVPAAHGQPAMSPAQGRGCHDVGVCRDHWVIRWAVRVCPADVSRSASTVPIAVAGVRTPARSGRRSWSSARQSALSPSITDVAA